MLPKSFDEIDLDRDPTFLERSREARVYGEGLGERAPTAIAEAIAVAFSRNTLNDLELEGLADKLGDLSKQPAHRALRKDLLTRGLARFLTESEASVERLRAAGQLVERVDLDLELLGQLIAADASSESWRGLLAAMKIDVVSINDDPYRASDDVAAWQAERKKSVPSWRSGDFPPGGYREQLIASAVLSILDTNAWFQLLDRLPIPGIIEAMLWYKAAPPTQVVDWLRSAPLGFDADGKRTNSVLVFILERSLSKLVETLVTRSDEEDAITQTASIQTELAAALASRADGKVLLLELGAHKLLRAQAFPSNTTYDARRQAIQRSLASTYAEHAGDASERLALCRQRAIDDHERSLFGLWLVHIGGTAVPIGELAVQSWDWLVELLVAEDENLARRHSATESWTEAVAGHVLVATPNPIERLESCWQQLAEQRQRVVANPYDADLLSTSRFLVRAGFYAARIGNSAQLWTASMEMALTLWLVSVRDGEFAGVRFGLAHLAAGKMAVQDEPGKTLAYLVGERDAFGSAATALLDNGLGVAELEASARAAGIDALGYVQLLGDRTQRELRAGLLEHFKPTN